MHQRVVLKWFGGGRQKHATNTVTFFCCVVDGDRNIVHQQLKAPADLQAGMFSVLATTAAIFTNILK